MSRPIGKIYMCRGCAVHYNFFGDHLLAPEGSVCIRCSDPKPYEIPVSCPDNYNPSDWISTNEPAGKPWYVVSQVGCEMEELND